MKEASSLSLVLPFQDWKDTSSGGMDILASLNAQPTDRILIVGCAEGIMGKMIKNKGCTVIGIDNNVSVLEKARENGIDARLMNGESLIFKSEFDAAISYSSLQWMRHPDKVIFGVWKALKPEGRFVGELGAYGNLNIVIEAFLRALKNRNLGGRYLIPWYFPNIEDYNRRLTKGGFLVDTLEEAAVEQILPIPIKVWLRGRLGDAFVSVLKEKDREDFYNEVEADLKNKLKDYGEGPVVEYRILRFKAIKTEKKTIA